MIQIAVLGYGTVGSGVVEVIETNYESIKKRAKDEISIKYVLDLREFPGSSIEKILVHDYEQIVSDPDVKIVVEVAAQKGVNYMFEASCGGGIPIIRPLNSSLTADEIDEISGILNGTTNYILTEMAEKYRDFDTVLKEAQELGYAERNPEADVEGYDACRKIAILSSLAYGSHVDYEKVYTEGISKVTVEDMKYANAMGMSIKLLATSKRRDNRFYAMVCPVLVGKDSPLYSVNGRMKGNPETGYQEAEAAFGKGKLVTLPELDGEFGFVTEKMSEGAFDEKASKLQNMVTRIRIKA